MAPRLVGHGPKTERAEPSLLKQKASIIPTSLHQYKAFGLSIASEIPCPELLPWTGRAFEPDIRIVLGDVPESLGNASDSGVRFQSGPDSFLLHVDNVARYLVTRGRKIVVHACAGSRERDIRLFLLGSAFGALFHQRGLFPLHASAVRTGEGCVLFCGASGRGKSTLAHAFVRRGYDLLTDDICAVEIRENGLALAHSGYPQLKLWKDVLMKARLLDDSDDGESRIPFEPVRCVLEKFAVPVTGHFSVAGLPIRKIYILVARNEPGFELTEITGIEKFKALKNQTYRFQFTRGLDTRTDHFRMAGHIGSTVPVFLLARPKRPFLVNELADFIEDDLTQDTPDP